VRVIDIAVAALALRASGARPQGYPPRLVPAHDEPDAGLLDRNALPQQHTALVASLWPSARQCVVPAVYVEYAAPALFARALSVFWPARNAAGARALQAKLQAAFPQAEAAVQEKSADAA
jgi:hypothetical protein